MDSPKFVTGAIVGALSFGFVVAIVDFSNRHFALFEWHVPGSLMMALPALAAILGSGYLYAAITEHKHWHVT